MRNKNKRRFSRLKASMTLKNKITSLLTAAKKNLKGMVSRKSISLLTRLDIFAMT